MYRMMSPNDVTFTPQIHKLWNDDEFTMIQPTHSISLVISVLEIAYQGLWHSL